jgi:hypothetical protein
MEITGKVLFINNEETPSSVKPDFKTRTFGLDTSVELNGSVIEGFVQLQTVNDKNKLLDNVNVGDEVKVSYSLKGTKKTKTDLNTSPKNPTNIVVYVNLNAYGIEVIKANAQGAPAAAPIATPVAASTTAPIPQPQGDVPNDIEGKPMIWNSATGEWESLPF